MFWRKCFGKASPLNNSYIFKLLLFIIYYYIEMVDLIAIIFQQFFVAIEQSGGCGTQFFILFISADTTNISTITMLSIFSAGISAMCYLSFFKILRLRTYISITFSCCFSGLFHSLSFCFIESQVKSVNQGMLTVFTKLCFNTILIYFDY